jgi:GNAT superfamily N-acetyltransferase
MTKFTIRPFGQEADLAKVTRLIQAAWRDYGPHTHYHIGDLYWRRRSPDYEETLFLWEDAAGELAAFAELDPHEGLDWQAHPRYASSDLLTQLLAWAEEQCRASKSAGRALPPQTWAAETEADWIALLEQKGYIRKPDHICVHLGPIPDDLALPSLPSGYQVRHLRGAEEIAARVAGHRAAWESAYMVEEKYRRVMAQPGYRPELDLVIEAPDGTFAACANVWLDEANRVGQFEPVATHPAHRRLGLGQALVTFGLRQLRAVGAERAFVCSWHETPVATRLYERCGLPVIRRDYQYRQERPPSATDDGQSRHRRSGGTASEHRAVSE